jgi:hypothetical protein
MSRGKAIERLVGLGLYEGYAVCYLDWNRLKRAVSHL